VMDINEHDCRMFSFSAASLQALTHSTDGSYWQEAIGSFWLPIDAAVTRLITDFGSFWQLLAAFGSFWQLLAAFGSFWQLLAATVPVLAAFGH
jgi:hypothetical protein